MFLAAGVRGARAGTRRKSLVGETGPGRYSNNLNFSHTNHGDPATAGRCGGCLAVTVTPCSALLSAVVCLFGCFFGSTPGAAGTWSHGLFIVIVT